MSSRAMIPVLVGMMLLTGVCNTLLTKYQDQQCVRDCDTPHPKLFEQPVLQTAQMFVGESGCWLIVGLLSLYRKYIKKTTPSENGYRPVNTADADEEDDSAEEGVTAAAANKNLGQGVLSGYRILLLALPAICDICGTTLMNAGLLMVAASIYQMTRGALVLFVGLFSVIFLRRKLHLFQWFSLVGVVLGVALVGLAGAISPDSKAKASSLGDLIVAATEDPEAADAVRVVVGVLLIAGAQIFTATQFVLEEWILERSDIDPLNVVGWEGLFGLAVTLIGMLILHFVIGRTESGRYGPFDIVEGWRQMSEYKSIFITSFLIMISIGGFNFFGLSITRSVSATSRSIIDTCRTLFIWMVSLGLGWESFKWLQVLGFALLVYFTFLFNGIVQPPFKVLRAEEGEIEELLPEEPIEHN
ncbi:integral membrane protein [Xylariales sp. PMI_506]|nr:integral membrane protein [Xylariales sp. PMI_506]